MRRGAICAGAVLVLFAAACGSSGGGSSATTAAGPSPPPWELHGTYAPKVDPANFVATIDNRYFPLIPGTTFHYVGVKDGARQTDDMAVTHQTRQVAGITATVVRDTVSQGGKAIERTYDWYAQDRQSNVWYLGEDSLELHKGRLVRASDSWETGVNGAKPGIIVSGHPRPGDVYRQEYYRPGGALDQARVLGTSAIVRVPDGSTKRALVTVEWSAVEPQLEKKLYVRGLGEVREDVIAGGHERFRLTRTTS